MFIIGGSKSPPGAGSVEQLAMTNSAVDLEAAGKPWDRRTLRTWRVCEQDVTMAWIWSAIDKLLVTVTPRILREVEREIPEMGGRVAVSFLFLWTKMTSTVLLRLRVNIHFRPWQCAQFQLIVYGSYWQNCFKNLN